jgi:hypothetical protein
VTINPKKRAKLYALPHAGIAFLPAVKECNGMKFGVFVLGIAVVCGVSGAAFAQEAPPPPPPRVGFQMAFRTGYSIPMGTVAKGASLDGSGSDLKMSDTVSGQVPIIVDVGGKIIPELFIGGYFGLGFGGTAGALHDECNAANVDCLGVSVQLGIEAQYHILPGGLVDPWLGYGIGVESMGVSEAQGNTTSTTTFTGYQYARLSAGADFRVTHGFGVGPFVEYSLGQYNTIHGDNVDEDIPSKAGHQWLTIGARFVLFP